MEYETPFGMISIEFDMVCEPDPSSGIIHPYINHWFVSHVGNRVCNEKVSNWLRNRIDEEYIEDQLVERYY